MTNGMEWLTPQIHGHLRAVEVGFKNINFKVFLKPKISKSQNFRFLRFLKPENQKSKVRILVFLKFFPTCVTNLIQLINDIQ